MQNVNYLHEKTHCCFLSATVLPSSSFYQRVFLLSSFVHSFLPSFLPPPSFCYVFLSFSASGLLAKFTTYIPASLSLIPSFTLVISCFNCISEILVINQGRELTNRQIFIKHRVDRSALPPPSSIKCPYVFGSFWAVFCSLGHMAFPVPRQHCPNYYGFIITFNVWLAMFPLFIECLG